MVNSDIVVMQMTTLSSLGLLQYITDILAPKSQAISKIDSMLLYHFSLADPELISCKRDHTRLINCTTTCH